MAGAWQAAALGHGLAAMVLWLPVTLKGLEGCLARLVAHFREQLMGYDSALH